MLGRLKNGRVLYSDFTCIHKFLWFCYLMKYYYLFLQRHFTEISYREKGLQMQAIFVLVPFSACTVIKIIRKNTEKIEKVQKKFGWFWFLDFLPLLSIYFNKKARSHWTGIFSNSTSIFSGYGTRIWNQVLFYFSLDWRKKLPWGTFGRFFKLVLKKVSSDKEVLLFWLIGTFFLKKVSLEMV